ncbi:MAG: alanine racemase [candidate division Zixibacteria bacterium]|nr:alanine racemase [candidate division Zixibacteria bacterium]
MFPEIDSPALLIESAVLERNLVGMQQLAHQFKVRLRPHIKTHKMPMLAQRQIDSGARGIAVAKLSEAEVMARHGLTDIQIANQIVGEQKIARLRELAEKVRVSCTVDNADNVRELSNAFAEASAPLDLLIEIDTGLHRCGLSDPDQAIELARLIATCPGVRLSGIMTHAGHAYATVGDPERRRAIAREEGEMMVAMAARLKAAGHEVDTVSVGSTPTARDVVRVPGITELRVGNYIFNDMIQVALDVATIADCALSVLTTVISVPSKDRAVIDAGSKALSLDLGAHGSEAVTGYGRIVGRDALLARLSEEHGSVSHSGESFRVGNRLRIIPNHACAAVNLYDRAYLIREGKVAEELKISARGCLT